jgi:glycosyltransferase involved in cell wall biosynthesis
MKVIIDDGLSTIRRKTGIGQHTLLLYDSLRKYAKDRRLDQVTVKLTNYWILRGLPPNLQRIMYLGWINTMGPFWHKCQNTELVHFTNYYIPYIKPGGIRYVVTIYDLTAWMVPDALPQNYARYIKKAVARSIFASDLIVTLTKAIKEEVLSYFTIREDKITVCHTGVRSVFRHYESLSTRDSERFFLFVGTIEYRKNIDTLIKALSKVRRRRGNQTLKLVLVGKKGFGFEEIQEVIYGESLSDSVSVVGYVEDKELVKLYNTAEALVLPSFYEGFGIPLIEAMACETPIVASDIPAFREVAGQAALFYGDPKDVDSLVSAMETVIHDRALRQNLIEAGRLQVHNFSWERVAQQHIEAYKKALTIVS